MKFSKYNILVDYNKVFDDLKKICIKRKICFGEIKYFGCDDPAYIKKCEYHIPEYGVIKIFEQNN